MRPSVDLAPESFPFDLLSDFRFASVGAQGSCGLARTGARIAMRWPPLGQQPGEARVRACPCYVRPVAAQNDMGGRTEYFGPIVREPDEPTFHESWEGRVFGMSVFVQTMFGPNLDAARYSMEQLPREIYLSSYYRRWLGGLERQLVADEYLGPGEVDARLEGREAEPGTRRGSRARRTVAAGVLRRTLRPTLPRWLCAHVLPRVIGSSRPTVRRPRFSVDDRIRVRARQAAGHTRQPGYVTGKSGVITAHHGAALFPDAHAVRRRERSQHLYTVAFAGTDLWGDAAESGTEVRVELFEPYLEPT